MFRPLRLPKRTNSRSIAHSRMMRLPKIHFPVYGH
jgi:hypothetical protein